MKYMERYNHWVSNATNETVKQQLEQMRGDDKAIEDAFYSEIAFGTAGLRGVMGAGSNCLNYYTITRATQGLTNYMRAHRMSAVCVTFDSRLNSQYFAELVARVMATNGIKCYITRGCQPTPFLSYIIRQLHCDIGVNITASHNPSQYNGYKVYDGDGCQLLDLQANEVTQYIELVDAFDITVGELDDLTEVGKIEYVPCALEDEYIEAVLQQNFNSASDISVVYTALNGSGYIMVPRVLRAIGVKQLHVVAEQDHPDGNFPTCKYPNPEKKDALNLAIDLAKSKNAHIVVGTDPDCDRLGVAVRHNGQYTVLTGNEVGILLCDYIIAQLQQSTAMPKDGVVVKTIVTSTLIDKICRDNNVEVIDVLTGFKYIGATIALLENKGEKHRFLFGFEESCGYLRGTYVRDKDAVVAAMLVCELANFLKQQGKTPVDRLKELYDSYGTYQHITYSYEFAGASGATVKDKLLADIRHNGIATLCDKPIVSVVDYIKGIGGLPRADVLKYATADGTQLIIRPSGTEPLIKCYVTVCQTPQDNSLLLTAIKSQLDKLMQQP